MKSIPNRESIDSEQRNPRSRHLQEQSVRSLVSIICDEDRQLPEALDAAQESLIRFLETVDTPFRAGGRLIYIGAGTSGRLGVLDSSEMGPTFQLEPGRIIGIIAGGDRALRLSSEGKEDEQEGAIPELEKLELNDKDCVLGISAGGTTPYVLGALAYAKYRQSHTALLTCSKLLSIPKNVDHWLHLATGPEVITGSTRMKAGTATKLALNLISSTLMIRCGYVHDNLMVRLAATNSKLIDRAARILTSLKGMEREEAFRALNREASLQEHLNSPKDIPELSLNVSIDAGASKTELQVTGPGVAIERQAGPGNILEVGKRGMRALLNGLFADLKVGETPFRQLASQATLQAGMAGSSCEKVRSQLLELLEEQGFRREKIQLCNDVEQVLGESSESRIVLAAGTGSYCVGKREGERFSAGGLGKVLGDEGSGYWIGLQAIKKAREGGALAQRIRRHFSVEQVRGLIAPLTQGSYSKDQVAALARDVVELAENDDAESQAILDAAANELFQLAQSVRQQMQEAACSIDFAGSLLCRTQYLPAQVRRLEQAARKKKIIGAFEGTELPDPQFLDSLGGVILFDRNISSPSQLRRLCVGLRQAGIQEIAIDQEGGLVSRLPAEKGFPTFPAAADLESPDAVYKAALAQAELLFSLGITLNLAPVLDLAVNPENFIAKKRRCYSHAVDEVVAKTQAFVKAHREFGIKTALKHFPGHGSSHKDSHEGFVDVTETWKSVELEPFRQVIAEGYADMVMTAHLVHLDIDPELPASLSKAHMRVLREDLAFQGPVITDDLSMKAISSRYSPEQAQELALNAGANYLICA